MAKDERNEDGASLKAFAVRASAWAERLNKALEWSCGLLMAAMVVIVWMGAFSRYLMDLGFTWTEELARYVMIWGSLLAVPVAAYHREHIGLDLIFRHLPETVKPKVRVALDLVGLTFFAFLFWFGLGMAIKGASQYATIFEMNMVVPFAAVPVTSALAALMIAVAILRDLAGLGRSEDPDNMELLND